MGEPDKLPGIQVYVAAPVALKVVDAPVQRLVEEAPATTVGNGLTVIVTVEVFVQPLAFVPVTVYVVVLVGLTTGLPLRLPGIQVYVAAPLALKVDEAPTQIVVDDALATTVGNGLTVIVTVEVFVQPLAFVPVTVYVVVAVGVTIGEPVKLPGIHT